MVENRNLFDANQINPEGKDTKGTLFVKWTVLDAIRTLILSGELKPGQKLSESQLVKQFGTSRSTIRESLIALEQEGLVDTFPKSGRIITHITKSQLQQAFFIRNTLEKANIETLVDNITEKQLSELLQNLDDQVIGLSQDNYPKVYSAMDDFHFLLCKFNDQPKVWEVIRREKLALDRLHELNKPHEPRLRILFTQHIEIYEALKAKDKAKCIALIEAHAKTDFKDISLLRGERFDFKSETTLNHSDQKGII
ncbi:MAG: GntR family transcriptional regulator [Candidatus Nanopelagicales bacterium]